MSEPTITIRRATPRDARAVASVHVASWQSTYPGIVHQSYIDSLSVNERADAWTRRLSSTEPSAPDVLVATTGADDAIGFISGGVIREPFPGFDSELHAIYLLKPFQGLGVGRRLVREWAMVALRRELHAAVVRVLVANSACRFYERLGAVPLDDRQLLIGGQPYAERWYGWRNLLDLAA